MPRIIFVFFFLSGFSALVYEVAWMRSLSLVLGSTAQAMATVLSVFLGGLAIGAHLGGKLGDRLSNKQLITYGYLEICVGLVAGLVDLALRSSSISWFTALYRELPATDARVMAIRLIISTVLLLLPTMLMGATLPVLVAYLHKFKLSKQLFSILYGINTLGAAGGSLVCCFLGFAYLGLHETVLLAVLLNVLVGGCCVVLTRSGKLPSEPPGVPTTGPVPAATAAENVGAEASEPNAENVGAEASEPTAENVGAEAMGPSAENVGQVPGVPDAENGGPLRTASCPPTPAALHAPYDSADDPDDTGSVARNETALPMASLYVIAFCTGLTALSYEVLWTRILRCYLTSLTYSFTIMISIFLLGLAIGSLVYERFLLRSRLSDRPLFSFYVIQTAAATACAISLPLILNLIFYCLPLRQYSSAAEQVLFLEPGHKLLFIALISFIAMFVPSIFIGILFPMIGTLAAARKKAASAVGTVYAFNTIGCVCGSILCTLVLGPLIGSYKAFQLAVLISTLTAAFAVGFVRNLGLAKKALLAGVPIVLAALYMMLHFGSRLQPPDSKVLAVREDATGIMRVIDLPKQDGVELELNGSSLAGTTPANRRYMRMLGHLPILLHKKPDDVLIACFGTGTTCGAVAMHPSVKHVDLVEISPMVLGAAPFFARSNYNPLNNPKVSVHLADVRNYLLTSKQKYDVITFEPPPPAEAGIVNLYTQEFYELTSEHLKDSGLLCQWVPLHQEAKALWQMMLMSAHNVFPYVSVWLPGNNEAVFLASKEPINVDFRLMQQRIDEAPDVKSSLKDVGLDSAMAVLSTYAVSGAPLNKWLDDSPPLTDDHPTLEFFLPFTGPRTSELELEQLGAPQVEAMVRQSAKAPGFNKAEFLSEWQKMHLSRVKQKAKDDQAYASGPKY